jgi:hypothetical protein
MRGGQFRRDLRSSFKRRLDLVSSGRWWDGDVRDGRRRQRGIRILL